ncbi:MAG: methylated-DNA--[protein]-cysteine S-methyltransferase [Anaerolineae bacterium]
MILKIAQTNLTRTWSIGIPSHLGPFTLWASHVGLVRLEFAQENAHTDPPDDVRQLLTDGEVQLTEYLHGRRRTFDLFLDWTGATEFSKHVWQAARQIPFGQTISYSALAHEIGSLKAQRAVGHALGSNPLPIFVPCHRVLRSDGGLGGFRLGLDIKRSLLALEGYTS